MNLCFLFLFVDEILNVDEKLFQFSQILKYQIEGLKLQQKKNNLLFKKQKIYTYLLVAVLDLIFYIHLKLSKEKYSYFEIILFI